MSELMTNAQFEIAIGLAEDALRFCDWAAGEGIGAVDDETPDPETFLFKACSALGMDDCPPMIGMVVAGLRAERARAEKAEEDLAKAKLGWLLAEGEIIVQRSRAIDAEARIAALEAELAARDAAYQSLLMTDAYLIGVLGKAAEKETIG